MISANVSSDRSARLGCFAHSVWGTCLILSATMFAAPAQDTWELGDSGSTSPLTKVVYGGGQFVAVGDAGVILTSVDGSVWATQNSGTTKNLRGVAYGNGLYLVTGEDGTALTSPDGQAWTARNARTGLFISGAAYGNGIFVVCGASGTTSGTVRFTANGTD